MSGARGAFRKAVILLSRGDHPDLIRAEISADVRRAVADEIQDALGDTELLPAAVRDRFDDLLHRLRTGREP